VPGGIFAVAITANHLSRYAVFKNILLSLRLSAVFTNSHGRLCIEKGRLLGTGLYTIGKLLFVKLFFHTGFFFAC